MTDDATSPTTGAGRPAGRRAALLRRLLPTRRRTAAVVLALGGLAVAGPAAAFWLAAADVTGTASADVLAPPSALDTSTRTATSITVTVSAPASGPAPTGYTLTRDGGTTSACTMTPTASTAASCTLTGLKSGTSYSLAVRSTLASWTSGSARSTTAITLAAPAPAAPVLAASSDSGTSQTDAVTNDTTPTLTGAATSGLGGAKVTILDGTTELGTVTAAVDGSWSFTVPSLTPLSDGTHTFTAKASLNGGALGDESTATDVVIDTEAPAAPTGGTVTCGNGSATLPASVYYCNGSTWASNPGLRFAFAATDPSPSGGMASYRFTSATRTSTFPTSLTTVTATTGTAVSSGSQTASRLFTSPAFVSLSVLAIDRAGNVSPTSTIQAVIDTSAPSSPVAELSSGCKQLVGTTFWCRSANPSVAVTSSDGTNPSSGLAGIFWTTDTSTPTTASSSVSSGGTIGGGTFATEGSLTLNLRAIDTAGNTSATVPYTIVTDRTAPSVSSLTLANGTGRTANKADTGDTVTVTFSEAVDPATLCASWDGSAKTGTVTLGHTGSANDTLTFGGFTGCAFGSYQLGAQWSGSSSGGGTTRSIRFNAATVALSADRTQLVVTLAGSVSTSGGSSQATVSSAGTSTWTAPTGSPGPVLDLAGNTLSVTVPNNQTTTGF